MNAEIKRTKIDVSELYALCNKERFFTCGTCQQYNKMFALAKDGISQMELSLIIYLCSEQRHDVVYSQLDKLFEKEQEE